MLFFYLASLFCYLRYHSAEMTGKPRLFACFGFFLLALLSKPMAISLPVVLLFLDHWPLRRPFRLLTEKSPFFLAAGCFAILTVLSEKSVGAIATLGQIPVTFRFMNAFHSLAIYLLKMIWPFNMMALYPFHLKKALSLEYIACAAIIIALTAALWKTRKKYPWWLLAGAFYLVTLLPVLGLVQAGGQAAADRYTYLPSLAPLACLAAILVLLFKKTPIVFLSISIGLFLILGLVAHRQLQTWDGSIPLWEHALEVDPRNSSAVFACLGDAYQEAGRPEEALRALDYALAIDPNLYYSLNSKGKFYFNKGMEHESIEAFQRSVAAAPDNAWAYTHLAILYSHQKDPARSKENAESALRSDPFDGESHFEMAGIYDQAGMLKEALDQLSMTEKIGPTFAELEALRGRILQSQKNWTPALLAFQKASFLEPWNKTYLLNQAQVLLKANRYLEARELFLRLGHS